MVEVNPRLTTAYVALTEALDINVAAAILGVSDSRTGAVGDGEDSGGVYAQ